MASRRRSLAHEVIGFQASYLVELNEHDETFFGPVSDSSDDSETELAPLSCPDEVRSDEEENLEALDNGVTRVQTGNPVTLQEKRTHSLSSVNSAIPRARKNPRNSVNPAEFGKPHGIPRKGAKIGLFKFLVSMYARRTPGSERVAFNVLTV